MRAISRLRLLDGMITVSCAAWIPLRMRVRKSAMGSVIDMRSPRRLRHAGDVAVVRQLAQADAAQPELSEHGARPAAAAAASLGLLIYDHFDPTNVLALALASSCLVAVLIRLVVTHRDNRRMLAGSR